MRIEDFNAILDSIAPGASHKYWENIVDREAKWYIERRINLTEDRKIVLIKLGNALTHYMRWMTTKEGYDYWKKIYNSLKFGLFSLSSLEVFANEKEKEEMI